MDEFGEKFRPKTHLSLEIWLRSSRDTVPTVPNAVEISLHVKLT
jgi:hypothetical protein